MKVCVVTADEPRGFSAFVCSRFANSQAFAGSSKSALTRRPHSRREVDLNFSGIKES